MFGVNRKVFGDKDVEERMLLDEIKHGRTYVSCAYYPEADEQYPGHITVNVMTGELTDHKESKHPEYRERYARYAKRELLKLHSDHDHRKQYRFSWLRDPYSVLD